MKRQDILSIVMYLVFFTACFAVGMLIICGSAHSQTVVQPAPVVVQPQPVVVQPPAVVTPPVVIQPPQVYVQPAVVWVHEYRPGPFGILMWGHWKRQQPIPQTYQAPAPGPVTPSYQQPYMPPPNRGSSTKPIPTGAVLVSRNWDESQNTSPGYWNHLCIYVGDEKIVESQTYSGVHEVSFAEYRARPQSAMVIFPRTPELGQAAAARAKQLVGLPYFKLSSVTLLKRPLDRGLNCVSVVEASYGTRLRRPDDAFYATDVFATSPPI